MTTFFIPGLRPFTDPRVDQTTRWLRIQTALLLLLGHASVLATWMALGYGYTVAVEVMIGFSVLVVARRSGWTWFSTLYAAAELSGVLVIPAVMARELRGVGLPMLAAVGIATLWALVQVRCWAPRVASSLEASQTWRQQ